MRPSTPHEQTWPSLAARKRNAAERRETEAAHLRSQAAELDRQWREYVAKRDGGSDNS